MMKKTLLALALALGTACATPPALSMAPKPVVYHVEPGNKPVSQEAVDQLEDWYECAVTKTRKLNHKAATNNLEGWWGYAQAADDADNGDVFILYRDRIVATAANYGC
jgi:hypothetical protein